MTHVFIGERKFFEGFSADTVLVVEDGDACLVIPRDDCDPDVIMLMEHFKNEVVVDAEGTKYLRMYGSDTVY